MNSLEESRKYRGHRDVTGKKIIKGKPRKSQTVSAGQTRRQRNLRLGLHPGQQEIKDPASRVGRSVLDHKIYSKIYNLLTETERKRSKEEIIAASDASNRRFAARGRGKRAGRSIGADLRASKLPKDHTRYRPLPK